MDGHFSLSSFFFLFFVTVIISSKSSSYSSSFAVIFHHLSSWRVGTLSTIGFIEEIGSFQRNPLQRFRDDGSAITAMRQMSIILTILLRHTSLSLFQIFFKLLPKFLFSKIHTLNPKLRIHTLNTPTRGQY
jgi:hypothetical protein